MAKKPAKAATQDELPPAMDYAQHDATWEGFVSFVKWGIVACAIICLALYAFIEGHSPLIGWALLALLPIGGVAGAVMGTRRA
ncbi:MAG TPA: aa3-type cytochrome c oxidase subunit IV [Devosia sp.]